MKDVLVILHYKDGSTEEVATSWAAAEAVFVSKVYGAATHTFVDDGIPVKFPLDGMTGATITFL